MTRISTTLLVLVVLLLQTLAQATNTPEGAWQGTLDAGGQKLRLVLTITKNSEGKYSGTVNSIDQGVVRPIDVITVNGDFVRIESLRSAFDGKLNADGSELTGQFSQGGAVFPLTFKRAQAATPTASPASSPTPPQRPIDVPVDVRIPAQPVSFKGGGKTHIVYELHITNFS